MTEGSLKHEGEVGSRVENYTNAQTSGQKAVLMHETFVYPGTAMLRPWQSRNASQERDTVSR
jgi:hypothetical protein